MPTLPVHRSVHDAVFDLHVSAEVPLQVELAGAVRALERLAPGVEVHVSQEVVHSVEGLSTDLRGQRQKRTSAVARGHLEAAG